MSGAPVQLTQASTTTNTAATVVSPNVTATAGNLIFYCASYDAGSGAEPTFAITDTLNNTYIKISSVWNAVTGCKSEIGYAKNIIGGTNALTLTVGGGANCYKGIAGWEWSGLDTIAPFTAGEFAEASQTATALSSGNTPTLATQPAIVMGFSTIKHALVGTNNLAAGSGYTSQGANFWDYGFGAGAQAFAALEYQRVTSTAAIAATFTATTSGNYDTWAAVFKESVSSAGVTLSARGPGRSPTRSRFQQFKLSTVNPATILALAGCAASMTGAAGSLLGSGALAGTGASISSGIAPLLAQLQGGGASITAGAAALTANCGGAGASISSAAAPLAALMGGAGGGMTSGAGPLTGAGALVAAASSISAAVASPTAQIQGASASLSTAAGDLEPFNAAMALVGAGASISACSGQLIDIEVFPILVTPSAALLPGAAPKTALELERGYRYPWQATGAPIVVSPHLDSREPIAQATEMFHVEPIAVEDEALLLLLLLGASL